MRTTYKTKPLTLGSTSDKAKAIRTAMVDYDSGSNWIVYVCEDTYGWAYSYAGGWDVLDKRSLCDHDLLVFKKADTEIHCNSDVSGKIMSLIKLTQVLHNYIFFQNQNKKSIIAVV